MSRLRPPQAWTTSAVASATAPTRNAGCSPAAPARTGSPRLELGYRFPQGFGEVLVSYRSLVSEGSEPIGHFDNIIPSGTFDNSGFLRSRLNVNVVDVDYSTREFSLAPSWDMKWKTGIEVATVYFDSRAEGPLSAQRESNSFWGVGPHLGLDLWGHLPWNGLAVYSRVEASALLGKIKQRFEEDVLIGTPFVAGTATGRGNQVVPVVNFEAGLSWTPPRHPRLRLSAGYEYEIWWYLGELADSHAELTDQGVFFRTEVNF